MLHAGEEDARQKSAAGNTQFNARGQAGYGHGQAAHKHAEEYAQKYGQHLRMVESLRIVTQQYCSLVKRGNIHSSYGHAIFQPQFEVGCWNQIRTGAADTRHARAVV